MGIESIGMNSNVQIREIDRKTGLITNLIVGHNKITRQGLGVLADYISAYFNSGNGNLLNVSSEIEDENKTDYVNKFKALLQNLPYQVRIGTNSLGEEYDNMGVIDPINDPVTDQPIIFQLSGGASTLQSALSGSLTSSSIDGYQDGITISYTLLSKSDTFENFKTLPYGVIDDGSNNHNPLYLRELALMSYNDKCWARISIGDDKSKPDSGGLMLNKDRIYDILWNINLVSINTQITETNA